MLVAGHRSRHAKITEEKNAGADYWISGPKRAGGDALCGGATPIEIDDDVRERYWRDIRRQPERDQERIAQGG
jgi:hypothetical protein